MRNNKTGSTLFAVVIISAALGVGVYSTLSLVQTELRLNRRAALHHEARLAAESLLQQSMADLKQRFDQRSSIPIDSLTPENNPLGISNEFVAMHQAGDSYSGLVLPKVNIYTSTDDFDTQPTEIIGGQVPPGQWVYIDPAVAGNQSDEMVGNNVFERSVELIAKATVQRPNLGNQTVRVRQSLLIRDSPLFAFTLFYNQRLEIAPGAPMSLHGNLIHGNEDGFFQANNSLDVYARVTLAGDLYHGRYSMSGKDEKEGAVRFKNGAGDLVAMKEDGSWTDAARDSFGGGWLESTHNNFFNLANQLWTGNVQTSVHGVNPLNPVGVDEYIEDTDPGTSGKQSFNSAYQIIQPPLNSSQLTIPDEASDPEGHKTAERLNEIEKQKYSYKAGLVVKVAADGSFTYHTPQRDADGNRLYSASGEPLVTELTPTENIVEREEFVELTHSNGDSEITHGLHDKRQAADLNLINLNVDELTELIHDNDPDDWGGHAPGNWWNGVVYVDFPQVQSASSRDDNVNPAISGWALRVRNGETIPSPSFASGNEGMSLATNQMMYVQGNYNADGKFATGSPTQPDDSATFAGEGQEAPAALIADSITFLSNNWDDAKSTLGKGSRLATDTEISAAILTGTVPSGKTGSNSYSGGVENFPRFLENWSKKSIRIRGSMVALFESEVGTAPWGVDDAYSAPDRQWGFNQMFAAGFQPPGTPNVRRYKAVDFAVVNQNEYEAKISDLKSFANQ